MVSALRRWMPPLPRTLARLENEMEGLMERFFGPEEWKGWEVFAPDMNVAETEERYEVTVELPGMKPEDFTVELKNGQLWISGEKKEEREEKGKTFHRVERRYGEFRRVIPLPTPVEEGQIEAQYKDGVLHVILPKAAEARPKHIQVKAE